MSEERDELGEYETFDHTPMLVVAARAVIARWGNGDLAEAVRALSGAVDAFESSGDCENVCRSCGKEDVLIFDEPEWTNDAPDYIDQHSKCSHCGARWRDDFIHMNRVAIEGKSS